MSADLALPLAGHLHLGCIGCWLTRLDGARAHLSSATTASTDHRWSVH